MDGWILTDRCHQMFITKSCLFWPCPSLLPWVSPPHSSASGSPTAGPSCDARPGPAGPPTQLPAPCFPPGTQAVPLGPPDSYRKERRRSQMMIIKCCTDDVWLVSFNHSFCHCRRNEVLKHQMWINPLQEIVPYECALPWHHWAPLLWRGGYVSICWCDPPHTHTHTESKYGKCWGLLRDSKYILRFSPAWKHSGGKGERRLQNIWWSFNSLY